MSEGSVSLRDNFRPCNHSCEDLQLKLATLNPYVVEIFIDFGEQASVWGQGASLNYLNTQSTKTYDVWQIPLWVSGGVTPWPMLASDPGIASEHLQNKWRLWNLEMICCCLTRLDCVCGPFSHSHFSLAEKCVKALHRNNAPWKWAFHTSASCAPHDANEENHTLSIFFCSLS